MKLYESVVSANSRKVRAVAAELGIALECIPLAIWEGEHRKPEFLAINPNGKVPVLVDGDFVLWESHAILAYLSAKYGEHRLLPLGARERANVERWLYWVSNHLDPAIGAVVFQKLVKPVIGLGDPDGNLVGQALEETYRYLEVLDGWLAHRSFVADELSIADFALAAHLAVRELVDLQIGPYKNVRAWVQRVESRPAWAASEAAPPPGGPG